MKIAEDDVIALLMFTGSASIAAASAINLNITGDRFMSATGFFIALGVSYGTHKAFQEN